MSINTNTTLWAFIWNKAQCAFASLPQASKKRIREGRVDGSWTGKGRVRCFGLPLMRSPGPLPHVNQ